MTKGVEVNAEHPHPIVGKREGKLPDLRTGYFTALMFVRKTVDGFRLRIDRLCGHALDPERPSRMPPTPSRRLTVADGLILVAALAVGTWVSGILLIPLIQVFLSMRANAWAARPVWLAFYWGSLLLRHTQPMVAVLTLVVLLLRACLESANHRPC